MGSIRFSPITGGGSSGSGVQKVANAGARLALTPTDGDIVIQLDNDVLYEWDATSGMWIAIGGKGQPYYFASYDVDGSIGANPGVSYVDQLTQTIGIQINRTLLTTTTDIRGVDVITPVDNITATDFTSFSAHSQFGSSNPTVVSQVNPFSVGNQYFLNTSGNGINSFLDQSNLSGAAFTDFSSFTSAAVIDTPTMNVVSPLRLGLAIGQNSTTHLNGYNDISVFPTFGANADVDNYTTINLSPAFQTGSTVDGITILNSNPQIDSIGINNYRSLILGSNIGANAASTVSGHTDIQISPVYRVGSSLGVYDGVDITPSFEQGVITNGVRMIYANAIIDSPSFNSFTSIASNNILGQNSTTAVNSYQELNFNSAFGANLTIGNYVGIVNKANVQAGASITGDMTLMDLGVNAPLPVGNNASGIRVDMTNYVSPKQKVTFQGQGGSLQNFSDFDTSVLTPSIGFGNNSLGGSYIIAVGSPVSGVFGFGNNLGLGIDFRDDMVADNFLGASSLGYSINGFVNQVGGASGKTFDTLNYMLAGGSYLSSSTGGTVTNLSMFRALGVVSAGGPGTLSITNEIQFHADAAVDGGSPTNLWAFRADSTNADNWFARNVVVGGVTMKPTNDSVGIEVAGTTKAIVPSRMDTSDRDLLDGLPGMFVFNTDTATIQYYDGSVWVDLVERFAPAIGSQSVNASGTITLIDVSAQKNLVRVNGNAAAVTVDGTTGIQAGTFDGQELEIVGTADDFTVTLLQSGNVRTKGSATLGYYDVIVFGWAQSDAIWYEKSRNF